MTDVTPGQIGPPADAGNQPQMDPALQQAIQAAQQAQADQQAEYECEHELEKAICAMATKGQIADSDADGAWRFGQAAYYYAQALQVLRTPSAPAGPPTSGVSGMSGERPVGDGQSAA